jgi:hypothetical protein
MVDIVTSVPHSIVGVLRSLWAVPKTSQYGIIRCNALHRIRPFGERGLEVVFASDVYAF